MRLFSRLNVGGPSLHVVHLTAGLRARGYETLLIVGREGPREGNLLDWAHAQGVHCQQVGGLGRAVSPGGDLRALVSIYRAMRRFRPHLVHTHTAKAGLLGRVAARCAGVPLRVHTFHGHVLRGYFGAASSWALRVIERLLARWSSALIAVSDSVRDDLVSLGIARAERIRVIPLGLDLQPLAGPLPRGALRACAGIPAEAPLVGVVGRLAPIKDLRTFLQAAARIQAVRPEVHFSLVGDGEERSLLEAQAMRMGLAACVHFHGWQRAMDAVYGDLDVVVNCSLNEGTPVALIEALAAARPVVATQVGGTPDVLQAGAYGRLVPSGRPEALAEAILATLAEPEAGRVKAEAGRRYVLAQHSRERLIDDVDRLYRELLARAGERR